MLVALTAVVSTGAGCVLVVGADGTTTRGASRGDVEWSSSRDSGSLPAAASIDRELARDVEARIRADSSLAGQDLTVATSGAVVTLHGRVADVSLLERAMRVAAETPGVKRVVSRITAEMEVR
jgi:osmotically-inducible protein OsmY